MGGRVMAELITIVFAVRCREHRPSYTRRNHSADRLHRVRRLPRRIHANLPDDLDAFDSRRATTLVDVLDR